ncbi:MAG: hypothetical protein M1837_002933, partial [Sclerophora amabilis]
MAPPIYGGGDMGSHMGAHHHPGQPLPPTNAAAATSSTSASSLSHAPPTAVHHDDDEHRRSVPNIAGGPVAAAAAAAATATGEDDTPRSKPRQFILMEDAERGPGRARVRVTLDQVEMKEIPDSYRKAYSVYPRSYFPMQMQMQTTRRSSPSSSSLGAGAAGRHTPEHLRHFPDDENDEGEGDGEGDGDGGDEGEGRGRTFVRMPMLDGSESTLAAPRMGRARRRKEVALNDLGYRMSWSNRRLLAGRT